MKLVQRASGLIMYICMERPDLQFSAKTVMSTIARSLEITKSRLRKIAMYLEDKPSLKNVYAYQSEVAECLAFGDSNWTADCETRRSTTAMLEKLGKHRTESVSCSS